MTKILNDIELPVISNIEEARQWAHDFGAVLTAGPNKDEVQWNHKNHRIWVFGDTTIGRNAPTYEDVVEAVQWGAAQDDLLVHCHAGMSRSTSIAWGISIERGADPEAAFLTLRDAQPLEDTIWSQRKSNGVEIRRDFIPNRLIVQHLSRYFGNRSLESIRRAHAHTYWGVV